MTDNYQLMLSMQIKVLSLQSIYDISIQYTGTVDNAFAIAKANQRSISDELTTSEVLIVPDSLVKDVKVLQYYKARNIVPATALINATTRVIYGFPEGEFPISL